MIKLNDKMLLRVSAVGAVFLLAGCARDPEKHSVSELAVSGTKSMFRTDSDMQKVLNKYASFDAKAVEKTTPTEARLQPTIADAVKGVLADQKRDSAPTALVPGVTSRDTPVPGAVGSLPATVYTPEGTGRSQLGRKITTRVLFPCIPNRG